MPSTICHFKTIRAMLARDLEGIWNGNVNPASGRIEDAAARDEHAAIQREINWLDNTIKLMHEACHV